MNRKQNTIRLERSEEYAVRRSMSKAKKVYLTKEGKALLEQKR